MPPPTKMGPCLGPGGGEDPPKPIRVKVYSNQIHEGAQKVG